MAPPAVVPLATAAAAATWGSSWGWWWAAWWQVSRPPATALGYQCRIAYSQQQPGWRWWGRGAPRWHAACLPACVRACLRLARRSITPCPAPTHAVAAVAGLLFYLRRKRKAAAAAAQEGDLEKGGSGLSECASLPRWLAGCSLGERPLHSLAATEPGSRRPREPRRG